jgi:hypothetical protein
MFRIIKKEATPSPGVAPEVTLEEAGYFFSGFFAALSVGVVFTVLSLGAVFTALSAAIVTLAKATATKRAQIK